MGVCISNALQRDSRAERRPACQSQAPQAPARLAIQHAWRPPADAADARSHLREDVHTAHGADVGGAVGQLHKALGGAHHPPHVRGVDAHAANDDREDAVQHVLQEEGEGGAGVLVCPAQFVWLTTARLKNKKKCGSAQTRGMRTIDISFLRSTLWSLPNVSAASMQAVYSTPSQFDVHTTFR